MLSPRSKVLLTLAIVVGLLASFDYAGDLGSWQREPSLQYWYDQWMLVGIFVFIAGLSIVFDIRRNK
jgi:hypothetical protein